MHHPNMQPLITPLFFLFFIISALATKSPASAAAVVANPFTPSAYLVRYWSRHLNSTPNPPPFLLALSSPLSPAAAASFAKLAALRALPDHLPSFCSAARLLCPGSQPLTAVAGSLSSSHGLEESFQFYSDDRNFSNYGTTVHGGFNSFKNYSDGVNLPTDSFQQYSRDSDHRLDSFNNYAPGSNVVDQSFSGYGVGSSSGSSDFSTYNTQVNVPNLRFDNYGDAAAGRLQRFSSYTSEANHGDENFRSYGRNGKGNPNDFINYAAGANVVNSGFNGYGKGEVSGNDSFTNYGNDGNVPENSFASYGENGKGGSERFANYRDGTNVGDDSFRSYAKRSDSGKVEFSNYGNTFNEGSDKFTGYGEKASGQEIGFKIYGPKNNNTFKAYAKDGVTFAEYANKTGSASADSKAKIMRGWVEPGKFFRESMLKEGTVMPFPDIRDRMPKRPFLPRTILSKLPFSSGEINETKRLFRAEPGSVVATWIDAAVKECEREPSAGETKRCVGSAEDMIDFAASILGKNAAVRTTEGINGSRTDVMIGKVTGMDHGRVTQSVSCHQSLYPYLLYYCHSVPKVRVYEADILEPKNRVRINQGVAICHIDTSAWSASHGAFVALGQGPGRIEVCHWIFENDMTWTVADQ